MARGGFLGQTADVTTENGCGGLWKQAPGSFEAGQATWSGGWSLSTAQREDTES